MSYKFKSVFVVGRCYLTEELFSKSGIEVVDDMESADLVQFTGGADVSPEYYLRLEHPSTYASPVRDREERQAFIKAISLDKPMAGICRGAQLLNIMMGGTLWQDVTNHATQGGHAVHTLDGDTFMTSSVHHQVMIPPESGLVLGWAHEDSRMELINSKGELFVREPDDPYQKFQEVEVVVFKERKLFCFQGHPEYYTYPGLETTYMQMIDDLIF